MKISIERGELLKALSQAQSVVERRNTIPILANVLLAIALYTGAYMIGVPTPAFLKAAPEVAGIAEDSMFVLLS